MKEMGRYCENCVAKLTPTEADPNKKEFFEAELLQEGSSPDYQTALAKGYSQLFKTSQERQGMNTNPCAL